VCGVFGNDIHAPRRGDAAPLSRQRPGPIPAPCLRDMRTLPRRFELHIPTKTVLKVLAWIVIVSAVIKLWPELVFLSLSLLLAVALAPLVNRMGRAGLSRSVSVSLIAFTLLMACVLLFAFVLPPLFKQGGEVAAS
jgi:predicted PurR-regulated permease PerM